VARMPSLSRRTEPDGRETDRDGLVDERRHEREESKSGSPRESRVATDGEHRTYDAEREIVSPAAPAVTAPPRERTTAAERDASVLAGPRPRASASATMSLIFGLGGALLVLTGLLAPIGVAAGVIGLLAGIAGFAATGRRHVAGRFDAMLGTLLSLGTLIIGGLAMSDMLSWLSTDTNYVARFNEWLVAQMPWIDRV